MLQWFGVGGRPRLMSGGWPWGRELTSTSFNPREIPRKVPGKARLEGRQGPGGKGPHMGTVLWVVGSQAEFGAGKPLTSAPTRLTAGRRQWALSH